MSIDGNNNNIPKNIPNGNRKSHQQRRNIAQSDCINQPRPLLHPGSKLGHTLDISVGFLLGTEYFRVAVDV